MWLHYPVQLALGTPIRYIAVDFSADNNYGRLIHVDVYNGGTKIKTFTGSWTARLLVLDMGSDYTIDRGLSISFHTVTQDNYDTRFNFKTVAAFEP